MSDLLPLFPLPNVVLFPNVFLPLHVFESRYREMVADAMRGDRLIGMVLLRPGWEHAIFERHPTFFLVVRHSPPLDPSPSCDHVLTDASTFLFRCSARRD